MPEIIIEIYLNIHALVQTNLVWLIIHTRISGNVAIVDPGDATPVLKTMQTGRLTPKAILTMHHHGDHIVGISHNDFIFINA
ncbi:MAG: hypothetical protein IIB73_10195 [Proteobacteria bacterium]|nr:hypothetical protein [Pseudomonadota bacterium]